MTDKDQKINSDLQKRKSTRRLYVWVLVFCIFVGGYACLHYKQRASAIAVTKEWARLDDFPVTARNVEVKIHGSMFTREFNISFSAPGADIDTWLMSSPGTAEAIPKIKDDKRIFSIKPGGGAMFAEVSVDDKAGCVNIHTFWS